LIDHYQIKSGEITQLDGIGVNLQYYPRATQPALDVIRFIFVGRLLTEKGIYYFLQAAVALKALYPKVEFVILGEPDGKYGISRSELLKYVEKGIVVYPGKVKNVVPFLQQSSVFVLPSFYREGVPRSTQEAMAIGLPIITTDMPGCRETVVDGVNGFLVPPYDTLALQNAMLNFIQHPDLITQMGEQSYLIAQRKFDVKKINPQILDILALK
jgi:glycosyltransferase involved in cell wall biosynthesis